MCERAKKIQEDHKWEYGDWFVAEYGVFQIGTASFDYDMKDETKPPIRSKLPIATIQSEDVEGSMFTGDELIWLPRQDQLQGMLLTSDVDFVELLEHFYWSWAAYKTDEKYPWREYIEDEDKGKILADFASMEQLWLAFVMKEKFNKIWNGEDWINE